MNNLHRGLAPISDAAWADLESETRRTFVENVAGRRAVDVTGPDGLQLAAVNTGRTSELPSPEPGIRTLRREVASVVEYRVPFTVSRTEIDDVARGAQDADWQPAKDAAKKLAYAEDRAVVDGFSAAGVGGIRAASTNIALTIPADVRDFPTVVAQALSGLRLAGVAGPYALLLSAATYTAVAETTDHGYPITQHVARVLGDDGEIVWAPAISGALLLSTRGGDYELRLGQDVSIGYTAHDRDSVELYLQESFTFLVHTAEASVSLLQP